jgi:ketosteroid isomerase-like protein
MKRLLVMALVVGTICLPAPAQKKGRDDFNDLIKRYYAAWNTLNPDNASFLYAQDANLVFFDVAPLKYSGGWPEYRENFKKNVAPGFSSLTLKPNNDVKTTQKSNMALTTLTFHFSARQKDGGVLDFDARHTIVWEKRGGQWLIIHEHVSKPLF